MAADLVIGAQWGDEGKGKITDVLSEQADYIVRFQGGNNAGHTIIVGDQTYKLHLLPSGVVRGKTGVIGNGCVVDPLVLLGEIEGLRKRGLEPDLLISDRAHVITALHQALDGAEEAAKGDAQVGTTKRGIGPTYMDKMARIGLRMGDLVHPERLREKLATLTAVRNRTLAALGSDVTIDPAELYESLKGAGEALAPYITDTVAVLQDGRAAGKRILLEGAQGALLDIDFGTWPFVTSSNTTAGGAITGSGLPPQALGRIFGVVKAYTTRVGAGPFTTELPTDTGPGKHLAVEGHEFGTTTGRPRRCGWLDLVVVKHAVGLSGITHIALTKLDVLNGLDRIEVCTAYEIDGKTTDRYPSDPDALERAKPVYRTFPGWGELPAAGDVRGIDDLPPAARDYVAFIREALGVSYALIGTGPRRDETILLMDEAAEQAVA